MSLSSRSSSSSGRSSDGVALQVHPSSSNNNANGYLAYRHPPSGENDPRNFMPIPTALGMGQSDYNEDGRRRMGPRSVQNRSIKFNIPCAFSYAYDVPVPPQSESDRGHSVPNKTRSSVQKKPQRMPKSTSMPSVNNPSLKPFYTTVKSGEVYKAKEIPECRSSSRLLQDRCSVAWDFSCPSRIPFKSIDYGQELYEKAANNLARSLHEQNLAEMKKNKLYFEEEVEDNCYDFSKPGVHSSKYSSRALERAIESLRDVPEEVEAMLRKDKRFEPIVMSKATRSLNVPRNSKIYKDLIPVDPNLDVRTETEDDIEAEIKKTIEAARQPARPKETEPKLESYQSNAYTRMRPSDVQPPAKPSTGVTIPTDNYFSAIQQDTRLEDESNQLNI